MPARKTHAIPLQGDLLGAGPPAQVHRLFFALQPDPATTQALAQAAHAAAAAQSLQGRRIQPARYHVTLHFLGDYPMLREDIVRAASAAAGKLRVPAFELRLDQAFTFQGREPPCVLRCSQEPVALRELWEALRRELLLAGAGAGLSRSFTPHLTYAYSQGALPPPMEIDAVSWRVDRFSLVHSLVGETTYSVLGVWPLVE